MLYKIIQILHKNSMEWDAIWILSLQIPNDYLNLSLPSLVKQKRQQLGILL